MHAEVHECAAAQQVWETVANHWQATTGLSLDITAPSLTVMGLRPEPRESEPQAAKDRFHATEPAWRMAHPTRRDPTEDPPGEEQGPRSTSRHRWAA